MEEGNLIFDTLIGIGHSIKFYKAARTIEFINITWYKMNMKLKSNLYITKDKWDIDIRISNTLFENMNYLGINLTKDVQDL